MDLAQETGQLKAKGRVHKKGAEVSQPVGAELNPQKTLKRKEGENKFKAGGWAATPGARKTHHGSLPHKPSLQVGWVLWASNVELQRKGFPSGRLGPAERLLGRAREPGLQKQSAGCRRVLTTRTQHPAAGLALEGRSGRPGLPTS